MHAHIGTFTTWGDAGADGGIHSFALDPDDGALRPTGIATAVDPSFLAVSRRGALYAATHTSHFEGRPGAGLLAYAIEPGGALEPLGAQTIPSPHPAYVALDRTERFVLVASGLGGGVSVFGLDDGGAPTELTCLLALDGQPTVALGTVTRLPLRLRPGAPHPHCVVPSPDNRYVLIANLGHDRVHVLRFDAGQLTPHAVAASPPGGARHLVFDPGGTTVYVVNEGDSSVSAFSWDDGRLKHLQTVSTLPPGEAAGNTAADIHMHPSGRFAFASNRGHDSLATFAVRDDGRLRAVAHTPTTAGPRGFALTPDGTLLLVAGQDSGEIAAYRVDADTGRLEPTGARTPVPTPVCVRFTDSSYRSRET